MIFSYILSPWLFPIVWMLPSFRPGWEARRLTTAGFSMKIGKVAPVLLVGWHVSHINKNNGCKHTACLYQKMVLYGFFSGFRLMELGCWSFLCIFVHWVMFCSLWSEFYFHIVLFSPLVASIGLFCADRTGSLTRWSIAVHRMQTSGWRGCRPDAVPVYRFRLMDSPYSCLSTISFAASSGIL